MKPKFNFPAIVAEASKKQLWVDRVRVYKHMNALAKRKSGRFEVTYNGENGFRRPILWEKWANWGSMPVDSLPFASVEGYK